MDYADAVATFCRPRPADTPLPEAVRAGGPARRLRDACKPLAMHALWNRHTNERLAALGFDFLTGYVGGRAASWLRDGALTDAGRAARDDIEDRTDATEQPIVAALGGGPDEVCARLDGWSERCIAAGAFPADILKRAAG